MLLLPNLKTCFGVKHCLPFVNPPLFSITRKCLAWSVIEKCKPIINIQQYNKKQSKYWLGKVLPISTGIPKSELLLKIAFVILLNGVVNNDR